MEGTTIKAINIDWKVRFINPAFWAHIAVSFFVPIFTHFGVNWSQMSSWPTLFQLISNAMSNPIVVVAVFVSVWNCIFNPTTKGLSDYQIKLDDACGSAPAIATKTDTLPAE